MKLNLKRTIALSSAVCLTMALATGCNTAARTPQSPNQAGTTQLGQNMQGTPGQGTLNVPNANRGGLTGVLPGRNDNQGGMQLNQQINRPTGFDTQRADNIRRQLRGINGLQNSNVIVNGNTALVGYRSPNAGNNARNNAGDIRNTLTDRIRQIDNSITDVIATDSPTVVTEINKLVNDITDNSQANGLTDRFNRLIQSINPNNTTRQ